MRRSTENLWFGFCHSYFKGLPPATINSAINRSILDHGTAAHSIITSIHLRELVVRASIDRAISAIKAIRAISAIKAIRAIRSTINRATTLELPLRVSSALLRCCCSRVIYSSAATACVPHSIMMNLPTGHSGAFFSAVAL